MKNVTQIMTSDAFLEVLTGKNILQNKIKKEKHIYDFCFLFLLHF